MIFIESRPNFYGISELCVKVDGFMCLEKGCRSGLLRGARHNYNTIVIIINTPGLNNLKKFSVCVSKILPIIFVCCDIFCRQLF